MCRFEPSYLAVTICKDSESSAKGHGVPYDKKRLDSAYCNRGQKCKGSGMGRAAPHFPAALQITDWFRPISACYQMRCDSDFPADAESFHKRGKPTDTALLPP